MDVVDSKIFDKGVKVNAAEYIQVLDSKVKVHMTISGTTLFQQDSSLCHSLLKCVTQRWFADFQIASGLAIQLSRPSVAAPGQGAPGQLTW